MDTVGKLLKNIEKETSERLVAILMRFEQRQAIINDKLEKARKISDYKKAKDGE